MYDLSIEALNKYAKRSLEMGYLRSHNVLCEFIIRLREGNELTEGQKKYAESMAQQVTDDVYKTHQQWEEEIKDDAALREKLEVVARYYLTTGYHMQIANSVINYLQSPQPTRTPPYHKCQRMINNDYAKNVWESHTAESKFQVGDLVMIRGGNATVWLIVAIGAKPINTSHKYNEKLGGTKRYDLLQVGGTRLITAMEKELKKHRVPKTKKRTKNDLPK